MMRIQILVRIKLHLDPECEILNQIKFSAVFPINLSQMLWQISRNSRLKTNMSSLINNFVFPKLSSLQVQVLLFAFFTHWLRIQQVSHFAGPDLKHSCSVDNSSCKFQCGGAALQ